VIKVEIRLSDARAAVALLAEPFLYWSATTTFATATSDLSQSLMTCSSSMRGTQLREYEFHFRP
jgi:hypothetical protein